jgi:hypothetical protein
MIVPGVLVEPGMEVTVLDKKRRLFKDSKKLYEKKVSR